MIIWHGWGIVGALLPLLVGFAVMGLGEGLGRQTANGLIFLVPGLVLWPLGRWMNRPPAGSPLPRLGPAPHRLFFIPVEYFGPIYLVLSILHFAGVFRR